MFNGNRIGKFHHLDGNVHVSSSLKSGVEHGNIDLYIAEGANFFFFITEVM